MRAPGGMRSAVVALVIWSCGWTGRVAVESQPGVVGSGQLLPGEVTLAVLASDPVGSMAVAGNGSAAWVTMLTVSVAFAAMSPSAQVTVTPSADVQPSGEDTNVSPAGSVSVTTTLGAT